MASDKALVIKAGRVQQIPDTDALLVGTDTGSSIDTATATVLGLGRANATSIDIGDVGVTTTIKGDLTVDGAEIVTGSTTLNGDVIIGDNFAADDLTITAGVLNDITFRENASHSILVGAGAAAGGSLSIVGGTTTTAATAGGDAKMTGGAGLTTGGGGNIVLTGGASPSGLPGNIAAVTTRTANGTGATDGAVLTLTQAAGSAHIWVGATSPNGTVSGTAGDLYMRTNGTLYVCTATGTTWAAVGTATVDLQSAYNAGNQIGIASATPILFTNSSFTNANILEVTASQTGAGGGIAVSMGALTNGTGVDITHAGATGKALAITTSGAGSTGFDMSVSGGGTVVNLVEGSVTVMNIDGSGEITLTGGNGGANGSGITLQGGLPAIVTAAGGTLDLLAGPGGATSGPGGAVNVTGGDSGGTSGKAGNVAIQAGNKTAAGATAAAGNVTINAGTNAGTAAGAAAGFIQIIGGDSTSTSGVNGGDVYISAGASTAVFGGSGGGLATLRGGDSGGGNSAGPAYVQGGNGTGVAGGFVSLQGGTSDVDKPGYIQITSRRTATNGATTTDGPALTILQNATLTDAADVFVGQAAPNAASGVVAPEGSLYHDVTSTDGKLWLKTGAANTAWSRVATTTGPGAATLQTAYDNGATGPSATTILTTLADGGVQITKGAADTDVYVMKLTDAVAGSANDVLQISKTSAAAGFGASITMGASTTRAGLSISQAGTDPASRGATISLTGAGAGVGVLVAMGPGGQAVTGAGILSTMGTGSTGAAITATTAGVAAGSHAVSAAITGASSGNGVNVTLAAAATGRGINVSHAGTGAGASGLTVSMTNAAHTQAGALTAKGGAAAGTGGDAVVYVATTDTVAGTTGPALHVFGTKDHTGLYVQGQDGEAARIIGSVGPALVVNAGSTGDALQVKDGGINVITVDQFGVVTILGNNNGTIGSSVSMTGGAGVTGAGGAATLKAGAGGSASAGAVASVIGGAGGAATFAGGNVALTGGAGLTTGVGGDIVATGGASASGKPGHTQLVTTRTADGTAATDGPAATLTEAAGSASIWVGATNPNGTVTGTRGSLYLKNNDGTVYVNTDNSTGWSQLGTSTGSDVIVTGYVNGEAGTIGDGAPVCFLNAAGTAKVFFADSNGASFRGNCVGLANSTALTTAPLDVLVGGEKDVPDAIWDAVPAAADVGTEVFLSENSGKLTITAPTTSGSIVQKIGIVSRGGSGAVRVIVQPAQGILLT